MSVTPNKPALRVGIGGPVGSGKTALTLENGGPPDFVGVWISTTHHMVSGLVGKERTLTERSVLRIEPRRK